MNHCQNMLIGWQRSPWRTLKNKNNVRNSPCAVVGGCHRFITCVRLVLQPLPTAHTYKQTTKTHASPRVAPAGVSINPLRGCVSRRRGSCAAIPVNQLMGTLPTNDQRMVAMSARARQQFQTKNSSTNWKPITTHGQKHGTAFPKSHAANNAARLTMM